MVLLNPVNLADRWEHFVCMAGGREEVRLSAARGLELELNYCMPPDDPEVGRRLEFRS